MSSLRMKIAALASVAGLGALGGYALSSNTAWTATQTQAALTQKPKPKVKTQITHRTVHVKPKPKNASVASGPASRGRRRHGRCAGTGSRPGRRAGAGTSGDAAARSPRSRAAPRPPAHRNPSRLTPAAPAAAAAAAARASMSMRAAVMTEPVRPTEGHGTGTTARRASRAPGTARRRRAPSFKVTVVAALAGFLVVFELLAYQLRSGHDPAVGAGQVTAQISAASAGQSRQAICIIRIGRHARERRHGQRCPDHAADWLHGPRLAARPLTRSPPGAAGAPSPARPPPRQATTHASTRDGPDERSQLRDGPGSVRVEAAATTPRAGLADGPGVRCLLPRRVRVPRLPAPRRPRPRAWRHRTPERPPRRFGPVPVIVHRRIIVRRVVESTPAASAAPASSGTAGSSAASSSSVSAPAAPLPPRRPRPRRPLPPHRPRPRHEPLRRHLPGHGQRRPADHRGTGRGCPGSDARRDRGPGLHRALRGEALSLPSRQRALRHERGPAAQGAGVDPAPRGGQGRDSRRGADRRPGRSHPGAGAGGGWIRELARRGASGLSQGCPDHGASARAGPAAVEPGCGGRSTSTIASG